MNGLLSNSLVNGIDQQAYDSPDHITFWDGKTSDLLLKVTQYGSIFLIFFT